MATIADICSMYLLLTAATPAEIQPGIDFLKKNDFTFPTYSVGLLITGVGAVATTYSLTNAVLVRKPDIIIQAGIAGSFREKDLGKTVAVEKDAFGDMGVWEDSQFKSLFDLKLADDNQLPFTNRWLVNPTKKLLDLAGLEKVNAITINEISTDDKQIDWYNKKLSPAVESMEGAAFHYVCLQQNIPFIQIRAISNKVGERDKTNWKIKEAIESLNENLIKLFNELSPHNETYFRI